MSTNEQEEGQVAAPRERSDTPAAVRMRNWRAAQSATAKERRRAARQRTRHVDRERDARRESFERLSPVEQEAHRQYDCNRHTVPRRAKMLKRWNDEIEELVAARLEHDAADADAAEAAASAGTGVQTITEKYKVEVSAEVELSNDFIRACLNDRSDLFGPRPTVPLTKRARLASYRDKPGYTEHVLHSPSPLALVGWAPALVAAFAPFYVTGKPQLPALDALVEALERADAPQPAPLPPQPQPAPSRRSSRLQLQSGKKRRAE